jgi:hypothetical protein
MPKKYYDDLKRMGKTENLEYKEFKEQSLPKTNTTTTQTSGLPTWTNNYPCLLENKFGKVIKTPSNDQVRAKNADGNEIYFFSNSRCMYQSTTGQKYKGGWSCKNGKLYIQFDDGDVFDGDRFIAAKDVKNTTTDNTTTNTGNRTKYTKCPETVVPPIKQFCKNETIRKVQACLKMPKRYQTGNFGPITQEYLESRGQNGTLITTETIIAVCGANDPLVKDTAAGTPAAGTPAAGTPAAGTPAAGTGAAGTPAAGTPAAGAAGTGATGAVSNPQSKTGYEDYSFDEIEAETEKPEGSDA